MALAGHHYHGQEYQANSSNHKANLQLKHSAKLTREILCSYTDLTVLAHLLFFDSCLQTLTEKERGNFGCTGRKRAQMQSMAVEKGGSLVT